MRLILHLGMSKTGTSALQHALHTAAADPATWPISYPTWPEGADAHHRLVSAFATARFAPRLLNDGGRKSEEDLRSDGISAWATIKLSAPDADTMVISSEYLLSVPADGVHELAKLLHELTDDIEVVCYVRPPADHYVASLGQRLRASREAIRPCDHRLDLRRRLTRYADAFGDRLTVRPYQRDLLIGGDVVEDFRATFLPEIPPLPRPAAKSQNSSLTAEGICAVHELRRHAWTDEEGLHSQTSKLVMEALRRLDDGPSASGASLQPGLADAITWAHAIDLEYLATEHGLDLGTPTPVTEPCPAWTSEEASEILATDPVRLARVRSLLVRDLAERLDRARRPAAAPTVGA
jgi:hypothetical protein